MKIAVIGSGISGLSSAYYLSKKNEVDLFEKDDHFGGHSYTFDIKETNRKIPVDQIPHDVALNSFSELATKINEIIAQT